MKRGVSIDCIHFHSFPYTSERAREKVIALTRILARFQGCIRLHIVHFTDVQLAIYEKCPESQTTVLIRRAMMRIAQRIAAQNGCKALVTGESIGQVASQTLDGLCCTDAVAEMPVFRPCIGFDKVEIMDRRAPSAPMIPLSSPMRTAALSSPPSTRSPIPASGIWRSASARSTTMNNCCSTRSRRRRRCLSPPPPSPLWANPTKHQGPPVIPAVPFSSAPSTGSRRAPSSTMRNPRRRALFKLNPPFISHHSAVNPFSMMDRYIASSLRQIGPEGAVPLPLLHNSDEDIGRGKILGGRPSGRILQIQNLPGSDIGQI